MAIFMIETESVSSSSDSINSLSSNLSNISSSVSGYDVSCDDGFDFSGAKQVIVQNIEACVSKMSNTSKLMNNVVSSHNDLQSKLKFVKDEETKPNNSDDSSNQSSNQSSDYSSGRSSSSGSNHSGSGRHYSGGSSSGSSSSSGYSGSSYSSDSYSASFPSSTPSSGIVSAVGGVASTLVSDQNVLNDTQKNEKESSPVILDGKFSSVSYATPNEKVLSDESKEILNKDNNDYNSGYLMIDGRYVISCDASYGKVGDIIRFTQKNGNVVECIVGINTTFEKNKSVINFIVDKNNLPTKSDFFEKIIENSSKIENVGNVNSNTNSSASTNPAQSVTESSTTTMESSESSTQTDSSTTTTESSDNSTPTESIPATTESSDNSTPVESDVPVTNDETLTPFDGSTDSVLADNSSSFSDENLNSLMSANTDEDIQKVTDSIIDSSSNNSNNV